MNKIEKMLKKSTLKKITVSKVLLGFLFFIPFSSLGQIDFDSYLRTRALSKQTQDSNQSSFSADQSFHLKGVIRPSETFETHFWLLSHAFFDKNPVGSVRIYGLGKWSFTKELSLRLGRVPYETRFHQIVSTNPMEDYPYFFDGLFVNYSTSLINADVFGAYIPKQYLGLQEFPRLKYGTGIFLNINSVSDFLNHVNLHLVYLSDSFFETDSQKTTRYGIAIDGNLANMNLDYKLIGIAHGSGFKFRSDQNMYHVEIAYSQFEWYESRFSAGYHSDTEHYDPWLYDRYKNTGLLDLFLWGNLTYFYVGYEASFTSLFDLSLSFHNISSTSSGKIHLDRQGFALLSKDGSAADKKVSGVGEFLGREMDVTFIKKINNEFKLNLLLGVFMPGQSMKDLLKEADYYTNIRLTSIFKF